MVKNVSLSHSEIKYLRLIIWKTGNYFTINIFISRPRDGELSEFHPKATRTLFVGNISREVRAIFMINMLTIFLTSNSSYLGQRYPYSPTIQGVWRNTLDRHQEAGLRTGSVF